MGLMTGPGLGVSSNPHVRKRGEVCVCVCVRGGGCGVRCSLRKQLREQQFRLRLLLVVCGLDSSLRGCSCGARRPGARGHRVRRGLPRRGQGSPGSQRRGRPLPGRHQRLQQCGAGRGVQAWCIGSRPVGGGGGGRRAGGSLLNAGVLRGSVEHRAVVVAIRGPAAVVLGPAIHHGCLHPGGADWVRCVLGPVVGPGRANPLLQHYHLHVPVLGVVQRRHMTTANVARHVRSLDGAWGECSVRVGASRGCQLCKSHAAPRPGRTRHHRRLVRGEVLRHGDGS